MSIATDAQIDASRTAARKVMSLANEVTTERYRQVRKWGRQTHPSATGPDATLAGKTMPFYAQLLKNWNDWQADGGEPGWAPILLEEIFEAMEADNYANLREELVQSMAVIAAWIEDIDERKTL